VFFHDSCDWANFRITIHFSKFLITVFAMTMFDVSFFYDTSSVVFKAISGNNDIDDMFHAPTGTSLLQLYIAHCQWDSVVTAWALANQGLQMLVCYVNLRIMISLSCARYVYPYLSHLVIAYKPVPLLKEKISLLFHV
jgi:hypothetical protein